MSEEDGNYFINKLDACITSLKNLCDNAIKEMNHSDNQEHLGILRVATGQANLFITNKGEQFRELCLKSINQKKDEKYPITNNDLAGFWDLLMIQDENIKNQFKCLKQSVKGSEKQLEVDAMGVPNKNNFLGSQITKRPPTFSRYQSKRASQLPRQTAKSDGKFDDSTRIKKPDPINRSSNKRNVEEQLEIDAVTAPNKNTYLRSRINNFSPQTSTRYQSKAASQFTRLTDKRKGKLDDIPQITKPDQIHHSSNRSLIIEASSSKGTYNNMEEKLEVSAVGTQNNYFGSGITISPQRYNRHQSKGTSQLPYQTAKTTRNVVVLSQKTDLIHIDYSSKKSQNVEASSLRTNQYSKKNQLEPHQISKRTRKVVGLRITELVQIDYSSDESNVLKTSSSKGSHSKEKSKELTPKEHNSTAGFSSSSRMPYSNSSQSKGTSQLTQQITTSKVIFGRRKTEPDHIDYSSDMRQILEPSSSKGTHNNKEEKSKEFTPNGHNSIAGFSRSSQLPYSNSTQSKGTSQLIQHIAKSKSKVVYGHQKTEPDHIDYSSDMRQILEPSSSKGTHNNKKERFGLCLPVTYNDSDSEESVPSLTSKRPQFTNSNENTKQEVDVSTQTVINRIYSYNNQKHVESCSSKESDDEKRNIEPCSSKSHRTEVQPGSEERFGLCLPVTYNDSDSEESVPSLTSKRPQFTNSNENTKQEVDVSTQTVINRIYSYNNQKHVESCSSKESDDKKRNIEPCSSKSHRTEVQPGSEERFGLCLPVTYNDSDSEESVPSLTSKRPQFTNSNENTKQEVDVSTQTVINRIYSYNNQKHVESCSSKESDDEKRNIEPCSSKSHRTEVQPGSNKITTTVQEKHVHSKIKMNCNSREVNNVPKSKEKHYNYESLCRHCKEEVYGVRTTKNSKHERKTNNYKKSHTQVKNGPSGKKACCETHGNFKHKGSIVHSQKDSDDDDSWLFGLSKRITNLLPFCKTY